MSSCLHPHPPRFRERAIEPEPVKGGRLSLPKGWHSGVPGTHAQDRLDGAVSGLGGEDVGELIEIDLGVDELAGGDESQGSGALGTADPGEHVLYAAVVEADHAHGAEVPASHVDDALTAVGLVVAQNAEGTVDC